jgi:hypothetical protein
MVLGLGILSLLTTTIIVTVVATSPSCAERQQYLCTNLFEAPSKTLLTGGEIEFNRLGIAKLSTVRISPSRAVRIADSQYGGGHLVFESLGGYIDMNQIIPDWVGTTSWVPKAIPAYLVRFHYDHAITVDPSTNHFENILVNATNGKIISEFTYD